MSVGSDEVSGSGRVVVVVEVVVVEARHTVMQGGSW
jgi:hypothetical protein